MLRCIGLLVSAARIRARSVGQINYANPKVFRFVKSSREKDSSSVFQQISALIRYPASVKRGERVVTIVGRDAMDVMVPRDERRSWHAAKACGPDAPGLALSLARSQRRPYRARRAEFRWATVTNKVMDTGESTKMSR